VLVACVRRGEDSDRESACVGHPHALLLLPTVVAIAGWGIYEGGVGDLRTGRYKDWEHLIFVAHMPSCATEFSIFVANPPWCAKKCLISVAHVVMCATEIVKPLIGAGWLWGPPYFCGAFLLGAPQK
jgi:hypothetical protein